MFTGRGRQMCAFTKKRERRRHQQGIPRPIACVHAAIIVDAWAGRQGCRPLRRTVTREMNEKHNRVTILISYRPSLAACRLARRCSSLASGCMPKSGKVGVAEPSYTTEPVNPRR